MSRKSVLGVLILVAGLVVYVHHMGQGERARRAAHDEYEREFRRIRACDTTYAADYRLVRAFILAMTPYVPASGRSALAAPLLKRLASGKDDPFVVYEEFKKAAQRLIVDSHYGPVQAGWTVMDRYSRERPDFSKTTIRCTVAPVDFAGFDYVAREVLEFPVLPPKDSDRTAKVVVYNTYMKRDLSSPELDDAGFSIEDRSNLALATTWVGGGGRPGELGTVGDVVRPPVSPARKSSEAAGSLGIEWVRLPAGDFMMGAARVAWASPVHRVSLGSFEMSKTEVTNKQYKVCVEAGPCEPATRYDGGFDGDDQPVVGVDRDQARAFAAWAGARLPSEAEWEYAARSAGKERKYPWGGSEATCDRAVIRGCERATLPVCSKPKGNSEQGLCDMAGNVSEWVEDDYHESYAGASAHGEPWRDKGREGVHRGGSWIQLDGWAQTAARSHIGSRGRNVDIGFRIAR